jgi:hypothetical protein
MSRKLFKGIAHPPPRRDGTRDNWADLSAAEIHTANMGGTAMLVEHDQGGGQVGRVLGSWEGPHGELRVVGELNDPAAQHAVRSGAMRQLSLGTSMHTLDDGVLYRTNDELSLCVKAARPGCHITDYDGQQVASTSRFSAQKGVRVTR